MLRIAAAVLFGAITFGTVAGASSYRTVAYGPVWSPDGKHLAFVAHVKGTGSTQMLAVGNAEGRNARVVYTSTDACCGGPIQWASPSLIAFDDDYTVKTVSLATGRVTVLSRLGFSDFAVSRDGRWIAGWVQGGPSSVETIGVASITGSGYHELFKPSKNTDDWGPDFSPDGRQLAFARGRGGHYSLTVEPTTGGPTRTLATPGDLPQWSPDGQWIAFVRPLAGTDPGALLVVRSSGGHAQLLDHGFFNALPAPFSWSPDSKRLVYVRPARRVGLATIDLQGHRRAFALGSVTPIGTPDWSPDGKRIAFTGRSPTPTGQRVDVYVIGADGRGLRRIL